MSAPLMCFLEELVDDRWKVPAEFIRPCNLLEDPVEQGLCAKPFWSGVNSTLTHLLSGQRIERSEALEPLKIGWRSGLPKDVSKELSKRNLDEASNAGPAFWLPAERVWAYDWQQVLLGKSGKLSLEATAGEFLNALRAVVDHRDVQHCRVIAWLLW